MFAGITATAATAYKPDMDITSYVHSHQMTQEDQDTTENNKQSMIFKCSYILVFFL